VRSDATVQVRVAERRFSARARILSSEADAELMQTIQNLSREKYGWGDGLVVELVPSV
jgi:hypothetical protein